MVLTPESRAYGKHFILFGVAVLLLALVILTYLGLQGSMDYHIVEYASLGLVGVAMIPLVLVMFGQMAR